MIAGLAAGSLRPTARLAFLPGGCGRVRVEACQPVQEGRSNVPSSRRNLPGVLAAGRPRSGSPNPPASSNTRSRAEHAAGVVPNRSPAGAAWVGAVAWGGRRFGLPGAGGRGSASRKPSWPLRPSGERCRPSTVRRPGPGILHALGAAYGDCMRVPDSGRRSQPLRPWEVVQRD